MSLRDIAAALRRYADELDAMDEAPTLYDYLRQILVFEEGYSKKVYASYEGGRDSAGIGHKLSAEEAAVWRRDMDVPSEQIESWYAEDVMEAELSAKAWLGRTFFSLSPIRQALAIAMAFQMGSIGILQWMQTADHIAAGQWTDVKAHIEASLWYRQTPKRARRMAEMWVSGELLEEYRNA